MTTADIANWLLETSMASSLAIVLVLVLRKLARHAFGPAVAYALWLLIPAAMLAVSLPPSERGNERVAVANTMFHLYRQKAQEANAAAGQDAVSGSVVGDALDAGQLLTMIWLVGALLCFGWLLLRERGFRKSLGALILRADGLYQTARPVAGLPAVMGLWSARIVVPADFDQYFDADERMLMRAHEHAHIAAGDLQANALAAVIGCVFWFNPLLHWAAGRFRHDQEIACDARVLQLFPQARRQYAQAMLKAQLAPATLPLACNWGLIHPFKERVQMLRTPAPGALRWLTGLALVGTLTLGVGMAAWSAQPQAATPAPATATASAQPALGKVTVRLENATYAEAVRQVAEVIDAEVTGLEAFDGSDRRINFSFVDSDAKMVFSLIAEEAGVNVVFGGKKVVFSKS